ncbi:MAG: peptide MFS transporter [Planctomycetota bacterium]|nr:peptide MFS transporter [Planctomycetota bacterium]
MSNSANGLGAVGQPQRTFLGHPIGLYVLFFTEMWERFSYYGMRALLVLYMVDFFKMTQEDASAIYKWYTSLVYLTPLMGGYLADRYLGNKWSIIIGAVLMAIGHFLMAFEQMWIFYSALGFLIIGNGFFKPNMSVQVGRLYRQNDPRLDGAYTIFYMGINLGAFLSPFVCGALKDTPALGFHYGFGAAGVGMVLGLVVYLFGLPFVKELPPELQYGSEGKDDRDEKVKAEDHAMTEQEAEQAASVIPGFAKVSPLVFKLTAVALAIGSPLLWLGKIVSRDNFIAAEIAAIACFIAGWILTHLSLAVRDRVLAIYALFVFVVFFWGAFEQAGNAMNVWADQTTNRFLTDTPPAPSPYPDAFVSIDEQGFGAVFKEAVSKPFKINPVLTTSFQSINAAAIVLFAPLFAWLWLFLARRHINLSIASKMAIGVFLMGMAFALMFWAGKYENQRCSTPLASLPGDEFVIKDQDKVYFYDAPKFDDEKALERFRNGERVEEDEMIAHGGRLVFDESEGTLKMRGVLNGNHRDRMLRATAPDWFVEAIWELTAKTIEAKKDAVSDDKGDKNFEVEHQLEKLPDGFDVEYLRGFDPSKFSFDEASRTFRVRMALADKDYKQILVAGSDPTFRAALNDLFVKSSKFKVSSAWLFWFYILCTLGELCLSPVGLSMVSKLAPKKFATMLMGIWLLTSFFGNFTAGLAGENWEFLEPGKYFVYITFALVAASLVCFVIARRVTSMMHGVK